MSRPDRHGTRRISRVLASMVAVFFLVVGVAGYQRTDNLVQLVLFLVFAVVGFALVLLLFRGVDYLLDRVDRDR